MTTLPKSRGFTLLEIAIASALVGILLLIIVPHAYDSQSAARATQIERIATSVAVNWARLTNEAGLPTNIPFSALAATPSGDGAAEVLFVGQSKVASAYQSTYAASGIKPLNQLVDNFSGTRFRVAGSLDNNIWLSGGGANPLFIQFQNVSVNIVKVLIRRVRADFAVVPDGTFQVVGPWEYSCNGSRVCIISYAKML